MAESFFCEVGFGVPVVTLANDDYGDVVVAATKYFRRQRMLDFLSKFNEENKNVILLPGGAGSELLRAKEKYVPGQDVSQYGFNDRIWLDLGIKRDDGYKLEINSETNRDLLDQIIIAGRGLRWPKNDDLQPYKKAMDVFKDEGVNALLLGWDWRRNVHTAVDILNDVIDEIVGYIKHKVPTDKKQKVLKNVFIVGHSMGGMVAKLFFTQHPARAREIGGMISVGTPFYGYINQLRRIYEGEEEINKYYGDEKTGAETVARIYSSFTGLYSLLPIDCETYQRDKTIIGLTSYPVKEPNGTPADPYHKTIPPYPEWFLYEKLPEALRLSRQLAEPLPNDLSKAVFNLRTVKDDPPTPVAAIWNQDKYDPKTSPSPITIQSGPGDETIPYWSSRLASTPDNNVHNFKEGEHMTLMEQELVLRKILWIVTSGKRHLTEKAFIEKYGPNPDVATTEELEEFRIKSKGRKMPERYARRILQNSLM